MASPPHQLPPATRRGNDLFDATVGRLRLVLHRPADPNWVKHSIASDDYCALAFVESGRALYQCRGEDMMVSKGQMLFFPAGTARAGRSDPDDPWAFFTAVFQLSSFDRMEAKAAFRSLPLTARPDNVMEVSTLFQELERLWIARETGALLRCRAILMELLYIFIRSSTGPPTNIPHAHRLGEIAAILQRNVRRNYSIDELCEIAELSPSRFRALFKQLTGYPVNDYQNRIRINKARDLLLAGECSVTEAAEAVGFEGVYYFSRLFRKIIGQPPSHVRNGYAHQQAPRDAAGASDPASI